MATTKKKRQRTSAANKINENKSQISGNQGTNIRKTRYKYPENKVQITGIYSLLDRTLVTVLKTTRLKNEFARVMNHTHIGKKRPATLQKETLTNTEKETCHASG